MNAQRPPAAQRDASSDKDQFMERRFPEKPLNDFTLHDVPVEEPPRVPRAKDQDMTNVELPSGLCERLLCRGCCTIVERGSLKILACYFARVRLARSAAFAKGQSLSSQSAG